MFVRCLVSFSVHAHPPGRPSRPPPLHPGFMSDGPDGDSSFRPLQHLASRIVDGDLMRTQGDLSATGFVYLPAGVQGREWNQMVERAAADVWCAIERTRSPGSGGPILELINSSRLQLKFDRTTERLPDGLRDAVEALQARVFAHCGCTEHDYALQDCYALFTPADEINEEARAPQQWHLDAITRFPVAALLLHGQRWTEFTAGPYSDFSAGVDEAKLEEWCAPWKNLRAKTWCSESVEEWEHWRGHMYAADLVGVGDEGECTSVWGERPVAPTPRTSRVGDACIFWSNKVHRGPGTEEGEERIVLFCSWLPREHRGSGKARTAQSQTDYSFYDTHLEHKLFLSDRAQRGLKRLESGGGGREGRRKRSRAE